MSLLAAVPLLTREASADTLSNNLNAVTNYTELISGSSWTASSFATGNSSYVLSSATLLMMSDAPGPVSLSLYSDSSMKPGSLLGTLGAPASFSSGTLTPTVFGGNSLTLAPGTNYWLVLNASGAGSYEWAYAADNTGTGIGFTHRWASSVDSGVIWSSSDLQPMQMRVEATPAISTTPEPSEVSLVFAGVTLVFLKARKRFIFS